MRTCLLVLTLLVCFAVPAAAQTLVPINTPLTLEADHDGNSAVLYRCYVNGKQVGPDVPVSARVGNVVSCPIGPLAAGTWTLSMTAVSSGGGASAPATLAVTPVTTPSAPTNPRVKVTVTVTIP